jgi:hypothetical protein
MSIRVVAIVVDPTMLTLYQVDGSSLVIPQGDVRVPTVLEAMPVIEAQGYADIEFKVANPYKDFEELTKEAIRFFRIAKTVVNNILAAAEAATGEVSTATEGATAPVGTVGDVPGTYPEQRGQTVQPADNFIDDDAPDHQVPEMSQRSAVEEIMAQATPASSDSFNPADTKSSETIVAVSGDQVITGAEQLANHLAHAKKVGSTIGMENFFKRINKVIKDRRHSVEDLLRFMEKNDLPIADDGSLIVYKVLRRGKNGGYVDCHTRNVPQKIGSFVCVDPKLIDLARDRECSAGLHVARRGYIGGFGGDVCTIVKVAPEDVYVVPHRDPDKVRVRGYHILMELEREAWELLKNNTPMTSNPKAQKMLGRAVAGDHIGIIEQVQINGHSGTKVVVTPIGKSAPAAKQSKTAVALDDESIKTPEEKIDAEAQGQQMAEVIQQKAKIYPRQQKALDLMGIIDLAQDENARQQAARDLVAHKRTCKVSWGALGISDSQATEVMELAAKEPEVVVPEEEIVPTGSTFDTPPAEPASDPHPMSKGSGRKVRLFELEKVYNDETQSPRTRADAALEMVSIRGTAKKSWSSLGYPKLTDQLLMNDVERFQQMEAAETPAPSSNGPTKAEQARAMFDASEWSNLWAFKKAAKKSWEVLGFTADEQIVINENKPE